MYSIGARGSAYELELYVEKVGLSPLDAIKIGTLNGIKVMGLEDKLGTMEANKIGCIGHNGQGTDAQEIKLRQTYGLQVFVIELGDQETLRRHLDWDVIGERTGGDYHTARMDTQMMGIAIKFVSRGDDLLQVWLVKLG